MRRALVSYVYGLVILVEQGIDEIREANQGSLNTRQALLMLPLGVTWYTLRYTTQLLKRTTTNYREET